VRAGLARSTSHPSVIAVWSYELPARDFNVPVVIFTDDLMEEEQEAAVVELGRSSAASGRGVATCAAGRR
jgi:hypothetical protein